jgi:hypothetical protein
MIHQAQRQSYRHAKKYKYGFEVAKDYKDGLRLDDLHGNTRWQDATELEMKQLDDYNTFLDKGHKDKVSAPAGYKKI